MNSQKQLLCERQVLLCVALQRGWNLGQAVIWPWEEENGSLKEKQAGRNRCVWCCVLLLFLFWRFSGYRVTVLCQDESQQAVAVADEAHADDACSLLFRHCFITALSLSCWFKNARLMLLCAWCRCICQGYFGAVSCSHSHRKMCWWVWHPLHWCPQWFLLLCVCVATTGKNMRTACSCTKWSQSTSYSAQCFLNAGSLAAPGKLSPPNPCCATCQGSCTAHLFSDLEMEVLQTCGQNCFHAYCEILQPW